MLTLAQCRDQRLDIVVGCDLCRSSRTWALPEKATRFDDWAVGELFLAGVIRCAEHHSSATTLHVRSVAGRADHGGFLETWPLEAAEARG